MFFSTCARNALPGRSGITLSHVSTARTSAERGPCISPILRSATFFAVFSSNWKDSSSIESISSAIGSASTSKAVPMISPRSTTGADGALTSAISRICAASAPAA